MNKFTTTIGANNDDIRGQRANILAETGASEAKAVVDALRKEKRDLEIKKLNLTDLAPETADSLRPGGSAFDARKWFQELLEIELKGQILNIKLEAAEKLESEWFGESITPSK